MLRKAFFLVIGVAVLAAIAAWSVLRVSLAPMAGEVSLPSLAAPVEVRFDAFARPYVNAENLQDAVAVQGWLHASHRLWQMELFRRAGKGRMAQLLGPGLVETDSQLWREGVPQLARRLVANASVETLAVVDSYLRGVNAAIANYRLLPPEFLLLGANCEPWTRDDVFALGALMAFQSANNRDNELVRLALAQHLGEDRFDVFMNGDTAPGYPYALPALARSGMEKIFERVAVTDPALNPLMPRLGFGSNGWVVSGQRADNGVPLFAFDSHDDLGLPNLFYEVHLFFADNRQLRGWSVAGLPGVINGFNENIAWGFTNIGDTQDLFVETRSEDDPGLFLDGDQWYRAASETVSIPVAGEAARELTILYTRNGPLISEEPPISLAWTVHRIERPSLDSLLALNLARDWPGFTAALDSFPAPTLNATYADVHGSIGFRTGGVLPQRGAGNGLLPLDGSVPANRWQGLVPAARMPERVNPPEGFLAAANARVNAPGDGPLVSADNAAPYRIARIRQVLSQDKAFSVQDMQALQVDWMDGQAQMLLPALLRDVERAGLAPRELAALAQLEAWRARPVAAIDSSAALIFQQWYVTLAREVFAQDLAALWPRLLRRSYLLNSALDHLVLEAPDSTWWRGERGELMARALRAAVGQLSQDPGGEPASWRLDQRLAVSLRHELGKAVPLLGPLFNRADEPWGGGASTVGRARYSYAAPFEVDSGATVRTVAEMSTPPRTWSVMPGGQSGHPLSPHYVDQYESWLQGELVPIAARPEDVTGPVLRFQSSGL